MLRIQQVAEKRFCTLPGDIEEDQAL